MDNNIAVAQNPQIISSSVPSITGFLINGQKLINLTAHSVNLLIDGRVYEIPASGFQSRIFYDKTPAETKVGIPGFRLRKPIVNYIPDEQDNVMHIVSGEIRSELSHFAEREDIVSPYSIAEVIVDGKKIRCATHLAF